MNTFNKTLVAMLLGSVIVPSHATENAYTALVNNDKVVKEKRFSCTDSIYVFVETERAGQSIDVATIRWSDPAGQIVKTEKRNFIPIAGNSAYVWDGLEFSAGGSGLLSNIGMGFFDPSSGLEDVVGKWKVDITLDSGDEHALVFDVMC